MAVLLHEILSGRASAVVDDYPETVRVIEAALDRRAHELAHALRAAEESALVPARASEPSSGQDAAVELANVDTRVQCDDGPDARVEIGEHDGPWELLGRRWVSD